MAEITRAKATEVADSLLVALISRGATGLWFEPLEPGSHREAHRISLERGRRVLVSGILEEGLGDAVLARLSFLCDIDLLGRQPGTGRCAVKLDGQRHEVVVTIRPSGGTLAGEVRLLDHRGDESGATVASLPAGADYPEFLAPGTTVGPYRIVSRIGRGGMGAVYRVEHSLLRKEFAMKVLLRRLLDQDEESAHRFIGEARAAARVRDGAIVDVSDFGVLSDGRPYLVMELLNGASLEEVVERGALSPRRAVALARQVARALRAAHQAGVLHRDLTPSNIFLEAGDEGERVKLVDFGAAKILDQEGDVADAPAGFVIGTPYYMAPEQAQGRLVDVRADLYALGAILFELLTGTPPFTGDDVREIMIQHIREPAPTVVSPHEEIPPELEQLVARCLEKRPEDRYPTAAALHEELVRVEGLMGRKGWRRWIPA